MCVPSQLCDILISGPNDKEIRKGDGVDIDLVPTLWGGGWGR